MVTEKDILDLKRNLNEYSEKKEYWFKKKKEFSSKILELIREVKTLKENRDKFTNEVKELKQNRQKLNEERSLLIPKIKNMPRSDLKSGIDLVKTKKEIERLELIIETEALSFDKEQKVMQRINQLKKQYSENLESAKQAMEKGDILKRLRTTRKEGNKVHHDLRKKAEESQKLHNKVIELSDQVKVLKKHENEAFDNFIKFKKMFSEVENKLNVALTEFKKSEKFVEKKIKRRLTKEELRGEVETKMKKGKKLTTEDILKYQI